MKNFTTFLILILICSSIYSQNQTELKLQLEKNKIYQIKTSSEQYITKTILGQEQASEMKSFNKLIIKPISFESDFIITEIHFDSIGFESSSPKMNVASYKEGRIKPSDPEGMMNYALNYFIKNALSVKLSKSGKVLEISKLKEFPDSLNSGLNSMKGKDGIFVQIQANMLQNVEYIKGLIDLAIAHLPNEEIQSKDKWESEINLASGGFNSLIQTSYKIKNIEPLKINVKGDIYYKSKNEEPVLMGGSEVYRELNGLGEIEISIDKKTGLVRNGISRIYSQGMMIIKKEGYEMQVPIEVDIKNNYVGIF